MWPARSRCKEHEAEVVADVYGLLVSARWAEERGELARAQVRLVETLSPLHPAAELVAVLGRVVVRMGLEFDVGPNHVGHVPQTQGMALGAVIVGIVTAAISRPRTGRTLALGAVHLVTENGEVADRVEHLYLAHHPPELGLPEDRLQYSPRRARGHDLVRDALHPELRPGKARELAPHLYFERRFVVLFIHFSPLGRLPDEVRWVIAHVLYAAQVIVSTVPQENSLC